jgi:hypothetical protein
VRRGGGETEKECLLWVRVCTRCFCGYIYTYTYSRLRRLRRLIAWVREEVESDRGKGS